MRLTVFAMLFWVTGAAGAPPEMHLTLPQSGTVRVAFVVSDRATLIDIAGPMQVFDQVQSPGTTGFQTFTVSESRNPIKAGTMTIVPDYTFPATALAVLCAGAVPVLVDVDRRSMNIDPDCFQSAY